MGEAKDKVRMDDFLTASMPRRALLSAFDSPLMDLTTSIESDEQHLALFLRAIQRNLT